MLSGHSLMSELSAIEIISGLRRNDFVESFVEKIPQEYRTDLADMFSRNPNERPTAVDMCRRMKSRD